MLRKIKIIILFSLVVFCAYAVRNMCYQREATKIIRENELELGEKVAFIPFLVESSMMYSYAQNVANGEGIPEFDDKLTGMDNVSVNQQFSTGLEYALGYSYRLKNYIFPPIKLSAKDKQYENDPAFSDWCRTVIQIWASIVSGLIFLWLIALRLPILSALFGGLLHAAAPAAIARYTGQDIVRGNFTLPLIIATFLLAYSYLNKPKTWKLLLTAIIAFFALATWDMTQICFAVWGLSEILRLACKPYQPIHLKCSNTTSSLFSRVSYRLLNLTKRQKLWIALFIATVSVSLLIPYHRRHMLIVSPLAMFIFPVIFTMNFFGNRKFKSRLVLLFGSSLFFYLLWFGIISLGSFSENYGHFASLMKAKFKHPARTPTYSVPVGKSPNTPLFLSSPHHA